MKTTGTTAVLLALALLSARSAPLHPPQPLPEIPGWTLTIDSTVYSPKNLWDFIDGAAEMYITYGFIDLTTGTYTAPDSLEVRIEAYRHATPTLAFGIYAAERKPDYHFIEVGTQGYEQEGVLNFLSGEYYLKLSTHGKGERAAAALRSIAENVAQHLGRPRIWPEGLRHLPEQRQANSEGYIPQNLLGYAFLANAFTALYENEFLLFVIEYRTDGEASEAVGRYRQIVPDATPLPGGLRLADPNNGPVTLILKGNLLFGLVNPPSDIVEARYIARIQGE